MITPSSGFTAANAELAKHPIHIFEIAGYPRVFTNYNTGIAGQHDWIEEGGVDTLSITVSDLDGGADLGQLSVTVQDVNRLLTAELFAAELEGKAATIKTGFIGMDQADFILVFPGIIDTIDSANQNNSYTFTCSDKSSVLAKSVYKTGDDGQPTDNDHPKTLNAHPLDMLLEILETECGIDPSEINVAKIEQFRDTVFAGMQFTFRLDSPPVAKDFIEQQILVPLGGYRWINSLGQHDVNFFYPSTRTIVLQLNEDNTARIPLGKQADLVNAVEFRFDKTTDGKFLADDLEEDGDSITRFGEAGPQIVESDGMRSGLQGYFQAAFTARLIFLRYALKNLIYEDVTFFWDACILEPGDLVEVTHSKVPDRTLGVMGIDHKIMEVMDVSRNFTEGTVTLKLLDASYISSFGTYLITPDAMANYAAASGGDKNTYMFMANDSDLYSNSDPAHVLG